MSRIGVLSVLARARAWTGRGDVGDPADRRDGAGDRHPGGRAHLGRLRRRVRDRLDPRRTSEVHRARRGVVGGRARRPQPVDPRRGGDLAARRHRGPRRATPARRTAPRSRGDWDAAARLWGELGSPFARALALARGGSREGLPGGAGVRRARRRRRPLAPGRCPARGAGRRRAPSDTTPAPTRTGSPAARSRCSASSSTVCPTPPSPSGSSSRGVRSSTTSPRSSAKLGVSSRRDVASASTP